MKLAAVVATVACLTSLPTVAACIAPAPVPDVPDGMTATRDTMLSAQMGLLKYDSDVHEYASCLERNGGNGSNAGNAGKRDTAVEQLKKVAAKFNAELRAFKKRSGV